MEEKAGIKRGDELMNVSLKMGVGMMKEFDAKAKEYKRTRAGVLRDLMKMFIAGEIK